MEGKTRTQKSVAYLQRKDSWSFPFFVVVTRGPAPCEWSVERKELHEYIVSIMTFYPQLITLE